MQNFFDLHQCRIPRFADDSSPLHFQRALVGICAEFAPTFDERSMQRCRSQNWVRRFRLKLSAQGFESGKHSAHPEDGVTAFFRPTAVSGPSLGFYLDPLVSLM